MARENHLCAESLTAVLLQKNWCQLHKIKNDFNILPISYDKIWFLSLEVQNEKKTVVFMSILKTEQELNWI